MDTTSIEASLNDHPGATLEYDLTNYQNTGKPNFVKTTIQRITIPRARPAAKPR